MFRLSATINYSRSTREETVTVRDDLELVSTIRKLVRQSGKRQPSSFIFTVVRTDHK